MTYLEDLQKQQKELRKEITRYAHFYYLVLVAELIVGIFSMFLIYFMYTRALTANRNTILIGIILIQLI